MKLFYDELYQIELWGENLPEKLDKIYRSESRFVVVFISEHYVSKVWTRFELKSILAAAINSFEPYMLPARFDNTNLPGVQPTVAYIDLRDETPETFASKIIGKIRNDKPDTAIKPMISNDKTHYTQAELDTTNKALHLGVSCSKIIFLPQIGADEAATNGEIDLFHKLSAQMDINNSKLIVDDLKQNRLKSTYINTIYDHIEKQHRLETAKAYWFGFQLANHVVGAMINAENFEKDLEAFLIQFQLTLTNSQKKYLESMFINFLNNKLDPYQFENMFSNFLKDYVPPVQKD